MSEEPESPAETPEPPAEEEVPAPDTPVEEDGEEGEKEPAEAVFVEPNLAFEEYVAMIPALRTMTPASVAAAEAALKGWMKRERVDYHGYYPREEWEQYYQRAMAAT